MKQDSNYNSYIHIIYTLAKKIYRLNCKINNNNRNKNAPVIKKRNLQIVNENKFVVTISKTSVPRHVRRIINNWSEMIDKQDTLMVQSDFKYQLCKQLIKYDNNLHDKLYKQFEKEFVAITNKEIRRKELNKEDALRCEIFRIFKMIANTKHEISRANVIFFLCCVLFVFIKFPLMNLFNLSHRYWVLKENY